jgi:hypothetical protein
MHSAKRGATSFLHLALKACCIMQSGVRTIGHQQGGHPMTEHEYNKACAERERDDRWAAEACNDLLSATQANVLRLAMDCMPEAAVFLAETVFEQYGWPDAGLDPTWLNETGRVTWSCYYSYHAIWQAEIRNARGAA